MGRRGMWNETRVIPMKRSLFRLLAQFNKAVLPKQWNRDLSKLSAARKLLAGYRYWVTRNALDQ